MYLVIPEYFLSVNMNTNAEEKKELNKLRHFVCFKYKSDVTQEMISEVETAFLELEKKIKDIKGFEKGENNSPEGLNKGFNIVILLLLNLKKEEIITLSTPITKSLLRLLAQL